MTYQELFKHLTPDDIDSAEKDIEWIRNALEHPTYLLGKNDYSNMFELDSDNVYYIEYVKKVLEEKGYRIRCTGKFISVEDNRRNPNNKDNQR